VWRPRLTPFLGQAELRIIHCTVSADVAHDRIATRAAENTLRKAHEDGHRSADTWRRAHDNFNPISLPVPTITVDTTDGYHPALPELVRFLEY
jgi:hypothetical protein